MPAFKSHFTSPGLAQRVTGWLIVNSGEEFNGEAALKKCRVCSEAWRFNAFLIKCALLGFSTNYHVTADRFIIFVQLITHVLYPKCTLWWPGKKLDFEGHTKVLWTLSGLDSTIPYFSLLCVLLCMHTHIHTHTWRHTCVHPQRHSEAWVHMFSLPLSLSLSKEKEMGEILKLRKLLLNLSVLIL